MRFVYSANEEIPTLNAEELRLVYKGIEADPESWDQEQWAARYYEAVPHFCGTKMCFAGHASLRAGYVPAWSDNEDTSTAYCVLVDDRKATPEFIDEVATRYLGLTGVEAEALFDAPNTLEMIGALVDALTDDDVSVVEVESDGHLWDILGYGD